MEVDGLRFVDAVAGREDLHITLSQRSPTSFFRETLVFRSAEVHAYDVYAGDVWLYSEVEVLADGRYCVRIMFHGGGEKRHYLVVTCNDVTRDKE